MTTIDTANACCAANAGDTAPVTDAVPRTIAEACDVVTPPHAARRRSRRWLWRQCSARCPGEADGRGGPGI